MPNKKTTIERTAIFLISAVLLGSGIVAAAEIDVEFRLGYGVTDNITRAEINEIEEDVLSGGVSLDLSEETRRLSVNIRTNLDYLNYIDDTFDEEWLGGVDALVRFDLVEEHLNWVIQDNFGQRLFDPLAPPNPGNREDVNFFSTGPNFEMSMGARNFFGIQGRYSVVTYEDTPYDNDRVSGLLSIGRRTSRDAAISLNASKERVYFDNAGLSPDFDITEAFIRYEILSTRNTVSIDLGYSELQTDITNGDGYLLRVSWTRVTSPTRTFIFRGGSEYSNQGNIFRFMQINARRVGATLDIDGGDTPFRSNFFFARFDVNSERTRLFFEAGWNKDDYEFGSALDRDIITGEFFVERDVTRRLFVSLRLDFTNREYDFIDQSDDTFEAGATIGYRYTPAFNVFLNFRRVDRESNVNLASYTENRAVIGIAYVPSWGR